jgi:hypothetical protein
MAMNSSDATAGTDARATEYNNLRKDHRNSIIDAQALTDSATINIDLSLGTYFTVTLGGNRTFTISNATVGQRFSIRILQDGTGGRTVTWFSTIKWANGLVPTLITTAAKADWFGFIVTSAANYDGVIIGQNL